MMTITRLNPLGEALSLKQAMDRLLEDSFVQPTAGWMTMANGQLPPPVDLYETDDALVLSAAIPGVKPDNLSLTITGQTLTLRGEVESPPDIENDRYIYRERRYGAFQRQIALPVRVESDGAEATFENGVLTLRIPKAAEVQPRRIEVKALKQAQPS